MNERQLESKLFNNLMKQPSLILKQTDRYTGQQTNWQTDTKANKQIGKQTKEIWKQNLFRFFENKVTNEILLSFKSGENDKVANMVSFFKPTNTYFNTGVYEQKNIADIFYFPNIITIFIRDFQFQPQIF